jgi:hypothetical protein
MIAAEEVTYCPGELAKREVECRASKRTVMPSPFPGMDPYLEGSEWSSVHVALSAEMARQLAPKVRQKYIVRTARRCVTDMPEGIAVTAGDLYPDASVAEAAAPQGSGIPPAMVAPAPVYIATVMPGRVPHVTIEIRDVTRRELVTAIEMLSPTNKRGEGYREYLDKRRRLLCSMAHCIEIDVLRRGRRVPMQQALPPAPYFIFLSRAERRPIVEVWPLQLHMRLPVIPVTLLAGQRLRPKGRSLPLTTRALRSRWWRLNQGG